MQETKSQIDDSISQSKDNIVIKIELLDKLKDDLDNIIKAYKSLCEDLNGIKNLIEQNNINIDGKNDENKEKAEKYIENVKNELGKIIQEDKDNLQIIEKFKLNLDKENYNDSYSKDSNSKPVEEVENEKNFEILEKSEQENTKYNQFYDESKIKAKTKTTEESTNTKDDAKSIIEEKFTKNFNAFIRILKFKRDNILKVIDTSEFP